MISFSAAYVNRKSSQFDIPEYVPQPLLMLHNQFTLLDYRNRLKTEIRWNLIFPLHTPHVRRVLFLQIYGKF